MNKTRDLSSAEWRELSRLRVIRDALGIEGGVAPERLSEMIYGIKFEFVSRRLPGYAGDLYILLGDTLGKPMVFMRVAGRLKLFRKN